MHSSNLFNPVFSFFERFFARKECRWFVWALVLSILLHYTFHSVGSEATIYVIGIMVIFLPYLLGMGAIVFLLWRLTRWNWIKKAWLWTGRLITLAILYTVGIFAIALFTPDRASQFLSNCEKVIPNLESYHQAKGYYPNDLETLAKFEPLPPDFEIDSCPYIKSGGTFGVVIDNFWDHYVYYDSERQTWE